jgi:hypothetical protein
MKTLFTEVTIERAGEEAAHAAASINKSQLHLNNGDFIAARVELKHALNLLENAAAVQMTACESIHVTSEFETRNSIMAALRNAMDVEVARLENL